jgi:tRNA1(Val) A37 N6-methylase TrmN6
MSIINLDINAFQQTFEVNKADKIKYGEIYTPFSLIDKMLDLFEPAVFSDPSLRWLDIGAGLGYFTMKLFERLNSGLLDRLPRESERKKHIIEHMLHMVEIKESSVKILREMFGPKANIIQGDFLQSQAQAQAQVQYDMIIGNPPYNSNGQKAVPTANHPGTGQGTGQGGAIWPKFIKKSLAILKAQTGQLCLIVPALWLKPDKAGIHQLLTQYKIHKLHCLTSTESNQLFHGSAQTPTVYFHLTKTPTDMRMAIYDKARALYVPYTYQLGQPLPLYGAHIVQKLQKWVDEVGHLTVLKTNMPSVNAKFSEIPYEANYPYSNIVSCTLEGLTPTLTLNYSDQPQAFRGIKKLVLAHKMYGFPYFDQEGVYGLSNRDNYVIVGLTDEQFAQLHAFLYTKLALYIFESTRYRMRYLEKYAFQLLPDITRLEGFPIARDINDTSVADFFGLDENDRQHIQKLHTRSYNRFYLAYYI